MSEHKGVERRMSQDEQLGYIRSKVEGVQKELTDFKLHMANQRLAEIADRKEVLAKLDNIRDRQNAIYVVKSVVRTTGLITIAVLSLNFDQVIGIIRNGL